MIDRAAYQLGTLTDPDREMIRRSWVWFVSFGAALTAIGVVGFIATGVLSLATAILIGWLLLVGGVLAVAHAILRRGWSGFAYDLASGCVTALIGGLIVARPVVGLAMMTAVIGVAFLLGGVVWLLLALTRRTPYGRWALFHGLIDVLLGIMILSGWPVSSEWVLGTLVAIELIVTGTRLVALGLAVRRPPTPGRSGV
jgi:uncharacterized membrane protein HdeD (DUF308 family)